MESLLKTKICVVGAGGWGTALAVTLAEKHNTLLWSHEAQTVEEINTRNTNSVFLPGIVLPDNLKASNNLNDLAEASLIVNTVPVQFIRSLYSDKKDILNGKTVVNGSKGIENTSLKRVSEIFAEIGSISSDRFCVITGPSHAEEVSRKMPTTVVVASTNPKLAKDIRTIFSTPNFRVYSSNDLLGCELGGSLKNVIAIAAGVIDGLDMGDNTKAALITRGLAEMKRLGIAMGADPETFSGLSALGDLIVTCDSKHSRNRYVGEQIGKGKTLSEILSSMSSIAEGVVTTESAYKLGKKFGVEMPITEQMHRVLFENASAKKAIKDLMTRKSKEECW